MSVLPSRRIADDLARQIETGLLRPGDRLPSEAELVTAYSVARMTARAAIAELRRVGYVRVEHGRGVFVSDLAVPAAVARLEEQLALLQPRFDPADVRVVLRHLKGE